MKVSFAALGLLLISAALARPLPETDKRHVAKVQNNTAPATKSLRKRQFTVTDIAPGMWWMDDILLTIASDWGKRLSPKPKQPISEWKDKENDRFESNSWALTQHELNILDAVVEETGQAA